MEQKTEASQAVKFRKKPVEIEAIQWTGKLDCLDAFNIPELHQSLGSKNVGIPTLEGTMIAHVGDWIIKGVKGEFYPCKNDIFELTYERAALKAQPAPTEAPNFCARCGKRLHAWSIHTCTPPAPTEAQGEDSARLDWLFGEMSLNQFRAIGSFGMPPETAMMNLRNLGEWARQQIDRARASAETGGVKS